MRLDRAIVAGSALVTFLAICTPVRAQQQGVTSGPAVGTAVVPSTAAQKDNPANSAGNAMQQGAVGVGAPGVPAKPGAEGGPSPGPGTGRRP
jgi:hypothetical protein